MARVIVHETFPFKLKNGSVQVLGPKSEYQIVKREIADALVASGRGVLDETDSVKNLSFVRSSSGTTPQAHRDQVSSSIKSPDFTDTEPTEPA